MIQTPLERKINIYVMMNWPLNSTQILNVNREKQNKEEKAELMFNLQPPPFHIGVPPLLKRDKSSI
jgi:hypothetical protein